MDLLPETFALTEFRSNTAAHVKRLRASKRPLLLTQNGRGAAIVMSPEAYERLVADGELARSIERVRRSMGEFERGETMTAGQARRRLATRYAPASEARPRKRKS